MTSDTNPSQSSQCEKDYGLRQVTGKLNLALDQDDQVLLASLPSAYLPKILSIGSGTQTPAPHPMPT